MSNRLHQPLKQTQLLETIDDYYTFQFRRMRQSLNIMALMGALIILGTIGWDLTSNSPNKYIATFLRLLSGLFILGSLIPLNIKRFRRYLVLIIGIIGTIGFCCLGLNYILLPERTPYFPSLLLYFALPILLMSPIIGQALLSVCFLGPIFIIYVGIQYFGLQEYQTSLLMHSVFPILFLYAAAFQLKSSSEVNYANYLHHQELATTDSMTGLLNRGTWLDHAEREFSRCKREFRSFAVIMLDIDHFKEINDSYGHPVGDTTIKMIANRLRISLRNYDLVGRLGGEEFAFFIANLDKSVVSSLSNRLREAVAGLKLTNEKDEPFGITISIGVAFMSENTKDLSQLMQESDKALYYAKEHGRNQVRLYEED